jgi:hypothetical protein
MPYFFVSCAPSARRAPARRHIPPCTPTPTPSPPDLRAPPSPPPSAPPPTPPAPHLPLHHRRRHQHRTPTTIAAINQHRHRHQHHTPSWAAIDTNTTGYTATATAIDTPLIDRMASPYMTTPTTPYITCGICPTPPPRTDITSEIIAFQKLSVTSGHHPKSYRPSPPPPPPLKNLYAGVLD